MMNETKPPDEREYVEALMMDALDGNLSKSGERELNKFLAADPQLQIEMADMQGINDLFSDVQMIEPPADFVQNTMAQLPRPTMNRWLVGFGVASLILAALAPLTILIYLFSTMPAQEAVLLITETVLDGLAQLVLSLTELAANQPLTLAIPVFMVGSIFLWAALYRRMVGSLRPVRG